MSAIYRASGAMGRDVVRALDASPSAAWFRATRRLAVTSEPDVTALIGSLPVNVAGIGAAQGAWLLFFLPFEEGTKILAFQLVWAVTLGVSMILRGLPFLPRALAQVAAK
jgi:hypothetical protein